MLTEMAVVSRAGYLLRLPPSRQTRINVAERRYLGALKTVAVASGIDPKKLTLHSFRRFFVSECAENGVPMATVMNWVGHDDMRMVMYYYNLRDDSAQQAMRGFVAGRRADGKPCGGQTGDRPSPAPRGETAPSVAGMPAAQAGGENHA